MSQEEQEQKQRFCFTWRPFFFLNVQVSSEFVEVVGWWNKPINPHRKFPRFVCWERELLLSRQDKYDLWNPRGQDSHNLVVFTETHLEKSNLVKIVIKGIWAGDWTFWHACRWCSRLLFRRLTGKNVSGHYVHHNFLDLFSPNTCFFPFRRTGGDFGFSSCMLCCVAGGDHVQLVWYFLLRSNSILKFYVHSG